MIKTNKKNVLKALSPTTRYENKSINKTQIISELKNILGILNNLDKDNNQIDIVSITFVLDLIGKDIKNSDNQGVVRLFDKLEEKISMCMLISDKKVVSNELIWCENAIKTIIDLLE